MKDLQIGLVIATRNLTFTHSDGSVEFVKISIGAPVADGDDAWACPYLIQAESFQKLFRMIGGDSLQSLIHTTHILTDELTALSRKHAGTFKYLGETDVMLPPPEYLGHRNRGGA